MGDETRLWRTYGAAVIGNYRGQGVPLIRSFRRHPRLVFCHAYAGDDRRRRELVEAAGRRAVDSADEILEDPSVRIVAIATAPNEKADWVERAAKAGKDVLLTQPMCDSLDAAKRIVWMGESNPMKCVHDVPLARFNPPFARLLDRAQKGYLGKVFSYYHSFGFNYATDFDIVHRYPEHLDSADVTGGGEMVHMGCHAVDFAVALLGRPRRVQAAWQREWRAYRKAGVEHFGQIVLGYHNFFATLAVGQLQLRGRFNHSNCLHLVAENRTLFIDSYNGLVIRNNIPVSWDHYMQDFKPETALDQLVRCIDEDSEPESSMEAAADGVEVMMAAYRSILEEQPIELPLGEGANPLQSASPV